MWRYFDRFGFVGSFVSETRCSPSQTIPILSFANISEGDAGLYHAMVDDGRSAEITRTARPRVPTAAHPDCNWPAATAAFVLNGFVEGFAVTDPGSGYPNNPVGLIVGG